MNKTIEKLSPLTEATFYILLSLKEANHGYGIIKNVESLTNERLVLAPGTLYGVIQKLLKYKLISLVSIDENNKNKKMYKLSDLGEELLRYEVKRIAKMLSDSKQMGVLI